MDGIIVNFGGIWHEIPLVISGGQRKVVPVPRKGRLIYGHDSGSADQALLVSGADQEHIHRRTFQKVNYTATAEAPSADIFSRCGFLKSCPVCSIATQLHGDGDRKACMLSALSKSKMFAKLHSYESI